MANAIQFFNEPPELMKLTPEQRLGGLSIRILGAVRGGNLTHGQLDDFMQEFFNILARVTDPRVIESMNDFARNFIRT